MEGGETRLAGAAGVERVTEGAAGAGGASSPEASAAASPLVAVAVAACAEKARVGAGAIHRCTMHPKDLTQSDQRHVTNASHSTDRVRSRVL